MWRQVQPGLHHTKLRCNFREKDESSLHPWNIPLCFFIIWGCVKQHFSVEEIRLGPITPTWIGVLCIHFNLVGFYTRWAQLALARGAFSVMKCWLQNPCEVVGGGWVATKWSTRITLLTYRKRSKFAVWYPSRTKTFLSCCVDGGKAK